jgi:aldehyde dehydrogenase (NAD+)
MAQSSYERESAEWERRFHMATAVAIESPVKVSATKLLINNQWVNSASGKTFPTINPSTGEEICQIS